MPVEPTMNKAIVAFIDMIQMLAMKELTMTFRNVSRIQGCFITTSCIQQFLFFADYS